jgi:hypothetical protein
MRAFAVAIICWGTILGQAALADSGQPESSVVPPASAQAVAPAQSAAPGVTGGVAAAPVAAQSADANLDEIVCKNSPPPLGSRLGGGRECHSQREWNRMQHDSEEATRREEREGYSTRGK